MTGNGGNKRRSKGLYGLSVKTFPKPIQSYLDYDYVHKLSAADRRWLANFNDRHYGADFREDEEWDADARRERYRAKNAANGDAFGISTSVGRTLFLGSVPTGLGALGTTRIDLPDTEDRDFGPGPEYLEQDTYFEALAAFRETLPRHRRDPFKATRRHRSRKTTLEKIVGLKQKRQRKRKRGRPPGSTRPRTGRASK